MDDIFKSSGIKRNTKICKIEDLEEDKALVKKGEDKYKRTIAECFINDISLSKFLVLNGYAFAYKKYSKQHVYHEKRAKILKKGLWSMNFEFPWKFRKNKKK